MLTLDAYTPPEIARRVEEAAVLKASRGALQTFVLAILAGAFIALGAALCTLIVQDTIVTPGLTRWVGGVAFSLGLILVCVAGSELFTGNNLLVMAVVDGRVSQGSLFRHGVLVYFGNFAGAFGIALLMHLADAWNSGAGAYGRMAISIGVAKAALPFGTALARGILCNLLVCLAVWMTFACRSVADRVLVIVPPIAAFVALGFEHSVANMYFIPAAWLAGRPFDLGSALWDNLLPVTIGNILGGGFGVGLVYKLVYGSRAP
ncbi:MAG: formate/nitrite transporter family protein [Planctomycetota bacterium]